MKMSRAKRFCDEVIERWNEPKFSKLPNLVMITELFYNYTVNVNRVLIQYCRPTETTYGMLSVSLQYSTAVRYAPTVLVQVLVTSH